MHWERGDITFLYCGDAKAAGMSLFVMDNELKVLKSAIELFIAFLFALS